MKKLIVVIFSIAMFSGCNGIEDHTWSEPMSSNQVNQQIESCVKMKLSWEVLRDGKNRVHFIYCKERNK